MASVTADPVLQEALRQRLVALRRRLRLITMVRSGGWLIALVLATAVVDGFLDWRFHLPAALRALFLVGGLSGAGYVVYRHLFLPLHARTDDLSLALRIESRYPRLNDSLASTVQFLEETETPASPALQREAVQQGLRGVDRCDLSQVVDTQGLLPACVLSLLAAGVAVAVSAVKPILVGVALVRLLDPFGGHGWPLNTRLEIDPPRTRIGRNEVFEVSGRVLGVIPPTASVLFKLDAVNSTERLCDITPAEDSQSGSFRTRLDPGKVQRDFLFRVRANDAETDWYQISVLPPPLLVPLQGKASPQVHLKYPEYTDLPEQDLPEGSGNVEAVSGTVVTLRAAANRPLAAAWIEYLPEQRSTEVALFLGPLAARNPAGAMALALAGPMVWGGVPATLAPNRCEFAVTFQPPVNGMYALHFEDETGLHNSRQFELRIFPDPPPTVTLERPTPARDNFTVLPDATVNLQVLAEDPQFALRSVYLEYRCRKTDPPRRLELYDHATAAAVLEQAYAVLVGGPPAAAPPRSQVQHLTIARTLSLGDFRHLDPAGSKLQKGDVLTLQACADDFDDVSVDKQPGRSHEVEIRIVGPDTLDVLINEAQARVQQELVVLRKLQQEALKKVAEVQGRLKKNAPMTNEDADQLLQAEQLQQQIRERVGNPQEGLRGEVNRILNTLRENRLPRTGAQERMEAVDRELERLAREELGQIEPRLTNARRQNDRRNNPPGEKGLSQQLKEARRHQEEVEKTLSDLLARLEPWTSTKEIKGEVKALLEEQRRLQQQTEDLQQRALRGLKPEESREQQAALDRVRIEQGKLEERTRALLEQMNRVAQERKEQDPQTADELKKAARQAQDANIPGLMQAARQNLDQNQLGKAGENQRESVRQLQQLVKTMEDRREAELDRLIKKMREQEKKLEDLEQEQERLRAKQKEAEKIADPQQRQEALKKLAREQEKLKQKTEEMVKQLSRQGSERSRQALAGAAEQMGQAAQQLRQGQSAEDQNEETLDRLADAQDELERARVETEEQLAREQLAKVADEIERLKQRQEGLVAEGARIQRELLQKQPAQWRGLLISLGRLADVQGLKEKGLAAEVLTLAENKLDGASCFCPAHAPGRRDHGPGWPALDGASQ